VNLRVRDWLLLAGVVIAAFIVGGTIFGSVGEILHVCGAGPCATSERFVVLNAGAGLAVTAATVAILLVIGRRRGS
jgi:hypothetical protein